MCLIGTLHRVIHVQRATSAPTNATNQCTYVADVETSGSGSVVPATVIVNGARTVGANPDPGGPGVLIAALRVGSSPDRRVFGDPRAYLFDETQVVDSLTANDTLYARGNCGLGPTGQPASLQVTTGHHEQGIRVCGKPKPP